MSDLNYHHLRYFHEVAREGHLGRAAERMNVSQSALSIQIRQLEARLGHDLFDRVGRRLALTEAGRIALDHADRIFGAGEELLATLRQAGSVAAPLRVGSLSTLSRNFQMRFLEPVLSRGDVDIVLTSGDTRTLLAGLRSLALDVVLTTELPGGDAAAGLAAQRIDDQAVGLHGRPDRLTGGTLREMLATEPLILPTDAAIRAGFAALTARLGVAPRVVADVDDMAMVRLLARAGVGLAVAPAVVLADEIASGRLATAPFDLGLRVPFHAVTILRRFPHPALASLLA
ncbi:LysR family transcriptional regulator [Jannaschia pohangensis]|uniref:LysR family transcriptional regulator, transcriptional activator of nhaA n=1 Tax=Jannaschia pohangensis TaxID=390807 RepID=A0A1I3HZB8_9RHOB|nr:LysR family transcriptional regulator [Jannaschia pohangensis]SFI41041.1 LysR family transcriptional regulator, transcriptional activator of nhaA [Jannaschia pohangensis]